MYVWRDVQTKAGYTDVMVRYRNALAREVNFIFSPRYKKVHEDEKAALEYEALKRSRQRILDSIEDPAVKTRVEIGLLLEALSPSADLKTAELFMRYFGLSTENVGADVYYVMHQPNSIYMRMQKEKRWIEAIQFLKFFSWDDASQEFENIMKDVFDLKNTEVFMILVKELELPPFDRMKRDPDIRKILEKECDRAISERRLDQAKEIVSTLEDRERENLIFAAEALISRDLNKAFSLIKNLVHVQKLHNLIASIYAEEMKRGEKDVDGLRNAFMLALHGKLITEGNRRYIEHPANKLLEHLVGSPDATDLDYEEALRYARDANPRHLSNVLARKCMDLIAQNDTKAAEKLKETFNPNFSPAMYDEEKNVNSKFARLTETKGIYDIPKGEENLRMAFDIANIFGFPKSDIDEINNLLCKFYISNKNYEKARNYFNPENDDIMELIESELHKKVQISDFNSPYKMLHSLGLKFSRTSKNKVVRELKDFMQSHRSDTNPSSIAKFMVLEDIYDLNILPGSYYWEVILNGQEGGSEGANLLIDLKEVLNRRIDSYLKIELYKIAQSYQQNNDPVGNRLFDAFSSSFPPSMIDWIIYFVMKIFNSY